MMFFVLLLALGLREANACCPPEQWQTRAFDLNSLATSLPHYMTIGHDDNVRMEGTYLHVIGTGAVFKHVIKDYDAKLQYETDVNADICIISSFDETFMSREDCDKDNITRDSFPNYKSYGNAIVGVSPRSLQVETMSYDFDGHNVLTGIAQEDCLPLYERIQAPSGIANKTLLYFNTTITAPDSNLMTIPAACRSDK